jgi:hypothetical protein
MYMPTTGWMDGWMDGYRSDREKKGFGADVT